MKKIASVFLCIALSVAGVSAALSRVSVQDNRFVTADGRTIIFRGLDTSDPDKLERNGQWNQHYFEEARAWGIVDRVEGARADEKDKDKE